MAKRNDMNELTPVTEVAGQPTGESDTREVVEPDSGAPGRLRSLMVAKFPDKEFADDAELENGVADYLEDADEQLTGYKLADDTIRRVASEHPEIMDITEDLARDPKMPLTVAIARNIDVDEFYPSEGDPDYDAMYKAREERVAKRQEKKTYQEQLEKNLAESQDIVQNYFRENEMSEAEAAILAKYIDDIMGNYLDGRITARELNMFRNAMNYDKDVTDAHEVGKVEGMNANIDAVRQRKQSTTDGLPTPGSSAGVLTPPKPEEPDDFIDGIVKVTEKRRNWNKS